VRRLCGCDLFLDTPFYNAGSTAPAVLWAGVPLLTLPGDRTAARLAAGVQLGTPPPAPPAAPAARGAAPRRAALARLTVARSLDEYRELLPRLARPGGRGWTAARGALRADRGGVGAGGQFDADAYARAMERAAHALRRLAATGEAGRFHLVLAEGRREPLFVREMGEASR
jgi:hypothetical protein